MESGLTCLKKLKHDHLNLNSYSRMRVDLAAQVSVASSLRMLNGSTFDLLGASTLNYLTLSNVVCVPIMY